MAKKQVKHGNFAVNGMTVKQILSLQPEVINSFDTADMSRALRTVALAANKRVNRLRQQAKMTKEGYRGKKSAVHNVAMDALNAVTKDGSVKGNVFGVAQAEGDRNKMLSQISQIRQFMGAKTSTIKGAKEVRQARERRLFGETTEEAMKRGKTKKEKAEIKAKMASTASQTYEAFRKYLQYNGLPNNNYVRFEGSENILGLLKYNVNSGDDPEEALAKVIQEEDASYQANKTPDPMTDSFNLSGY